MVTHGPERATLAGSASIFVGAPLEVPHEGMSKAHHGKRSQARQGLDLVGDLGR